MPDSQRTSGPSPSCGPWSATPLDPASCARRARAGCVCLCRPGHRGTACSRPSWDGQPEPGGPQACTTPRHCSSPQWGLGRAPKAVFAESGHGRACLPFSRAERSSRPLRAGASGAVFRRTKSAPRVTIELHSAGTHALSAGLKTAGEPRPHTGALRFVVASFATAPDDFPVAKIKRKSHRQCPFRIFRYIGGAPNQEAPNHRASRCAAAGAGPT